MCATEKKEWINNITKIEERNNRNEPRTFLVRLKNLESRTQDSHISVKITTTHLSLKWTKSLTDGKNPSVQS